MLETLAFRQLLRCVLHATMSTSFIVRVPVQNPCSPNGRPGHCKNHNTPSLKNVHLKNGGSVPCKACFAGSWFPYFYFTYCLGWTFFSVKRSVKESVCNCTPSYTELQMVLWWISIVLQSYDVWICLVLLTLALGTAEWFILGVGIYIYIQSGLLKRSWLATGNRNNSLCSWARFGWQLKFVHLYFVTKSHPVGFHTLLLGGLRSKLRGSFFTVRRCPDLL